MLVPDPPSLPENSSFFEQLGYGLIVGAAGLGWIIKQIFEGKKDVDKEPPKPVILERAELADMQPVRDMVAQWKETCQKLDDVAASKADIEETRRATAAMQVQLDKLARKFEMDEEVERRLAERLRDQEHRDREREKDPTPRQRR